MSTDGNISTTCSLDNYFRETTVRNIGAFHFDFNTYASSTSFITTASTFKLVNYDFLHSPLTLTV